MLPEPTEFFGQHLDADSCEILFNTRWVTSSAKVEPKLLGKKWFDYRAEHPVISTYRFGHIFTAEVRRMIRLHLDPTPPVIGPGGQVRDWNPIKAGDFFEPPASKDQRKLAYWKRKIGSLVRARQAADAWGIPYPFYMRTAVSYIYFKGFLVFEHVKLPEPGLLNGDELSDHVLAKWVEQIESGIQCATHPRYLCANRPVSNDPRHPDYADHDAWLIAQLKRKSDPRFGIRNLMRDGFLSRAVAEQAFGRERVDAAIALR